MSILSDRDERFKDTTTSIDWRTLTPCANHTFVLTNGDPAPASSTCVGCLRLNLIRERRKIQTVLDAVDIEGPAPAHHVNIVSFVRASWPTLWAAIQELRSE